jgi:hypothetical protein
MLRRLRRWAIELDVALLVSTFVVHTLVYQVAIKDRPHASADGFAFPFFSKVGITYVSAFERVVLDGFWVVWPALFLIAIVLKASYGSRSAVRYDVNTREVVNKPPYEAGDISNTRVWLWTLASAGAFAIAWFASTP